MGLFLEDVAHECRRVPEIVFYSGKLPNIFFILAEHVPHRSLNKPVCLRLWANAFYLTGKRLLPLSEHVFHMALNRY